MNSAWIPEDQSPTVLLLSSLESLRDEVSRVAAAAGIPLRCVARGAEVGRGSLLLLVGVDAPVSRLPPGPDIIVVGLAGQETDAWERAAALSAQRVAILPGAAAWLADYLSRTSGTPPGLVLGVVGAVGGAGASTLSALLANAAATDGRSTVLVDGDPLGGGLDLLLSAGDIQGIRWPDLADVRGRLNPQQLGEALPHVSGFSLLSWGTHFQARDRPSTQAVPAVMEALQTGFSLTVVDVGQRWNEPSSPLSCCDSVLLVLPARLRAIAAARNLVEHLDPLPVAAVVRAPVAAGLDPETVAEAAGCRFTAYLPAQRGLPAAQENGTLLDAGRRRSVRRAMSAVLSTTVPSGVLVS